MESGPRAGGGRAELVQPATPQVVGDDDVGDGVEHELDVVGVGGARLVAVDLLGRRLVLGFELRLDVGGGVVVDLFTCAGPERGLTGVNGWQRGWGLVRGRRGRENKRVGKPRRMSEKKTKGWRGIVRRGKRRIRK